MTGIVKSFPQVKIVIYDVYSITLDKIMRTFYKLG